MHDDSGSSWECSNLAVVMRIASRLHPISAATLGVATNNASSTPPPPVAPTSQHPVMPTCSFCSPFKDVLPCHIDELFAVCYIPRSHGGEASTYTCQPLRNVLDRLNDDHRDPFDANGGGFLPVDIGCGGDGKVILGSYRNTPVAMKVMTVGSERGDVASAKIDRRMKSLLSEATVGAAVHVKQNENVPGASTLARLKGVTVVCGHPRRGHTIVLVQQYYQLGSFDRLVHRRRRQQGLTRSSALPQCPLFTQRECVSVLVSSCRSLQFLHDTIKVVHRDVKPANMFLSFTLRNEDAMIDDVGDTDAVAVVLGDLGLTREATSVKTTCGTPKFMAPELVLPTALFPSFRSGGFTPVSSTNTTATSSSRAKQDAPYGPPVDIFGLGVSIQYAVSGGAMDAVRKYWVAPSANPNQLRGGSLSGSPRKVPQIMTGGGSSAPSLDTFVLPKSWCCSKRSPSCDCDGLHSDFIALINRMVNPNPGLRPTASNILSEVVAWPWMGKMHSKVRDHMHSHLLRPMSDPMNTVASWADKKGNVQTIVGPSLNLVREELLALLPARSAVSAAVEGFATPKESATPPSTQRIDVGAFSTVSVSTVSTWTASASALAITPSAPQQPLLTKRSSGKGFEDYVAYFTPQVKNSNVDDHTNMKVG